MAPDAVSRCFAPSVDSDTRLLLLGSLPGVESLRQLQYYAHPRNQFWRLMGEVTGEDLVSLHYFDRLGRLLSHGIGLWDVIAQASRAGSLDQNIREAVPNSLLGLVDTLPGLRVIAFNGATAGRIGRAQLAGLECASQNALTLVNLPSSSPANTMSYYRKAEIWCALAHYL